MITKYKTGWSKDKIEKVEVIRETEACVFLPTIRAATRKDGKVERREAKRGEFACYHDTWESAKAFCMEAAESNVRSARRSLELANAKLGNIKGMKGPAE